MVAKYVQNMSLKLFFQSLNKSSNYLVHCDIAVKLKFDVECGILLLVRDSYGSRSDYRDSYSSREAPPRDFMESRERYCVNKPTL